MKEFALLFRQPADTLPTPEQMASRMTDWENWIGGIAAQGKFIPGKRLLHDGKVLRQSGIVSDGPFVELKEQLGGFIIVKADNMDEAVTMAHGCPIFLIGGNVEIREIAVQ